MTLPKEIRDVLGIRPGDRVLLKVRPDGVVELQREKPKKSLMDLCGMIKPKVKGVTLEQIEKAIQKGWAGE